MFDYDHIIQGKKRYIMWAVMILKSLVSLEGKRVPASPDQKTLSLWINTGNSASIAVQTTYNIPAMDNEKGLFFLT